MNPEFINFSVTNIYDARPDLRGLISVRNQQYQIIGNDKESLPVLQPQNIYLWGIGHISEDFLNHPPLLSGTGRTLKEVINFAGQFGFCGIDASPENPLNKALRKFAAHGGTVISKMKRGSDDYATAVWRDRLSYLTDEHPTFYSDHVNERDLSDLVLRYGNGNPFASEGNGDFIRHHIRKREALRKIGTMQKTGSSALKVEFVHADHNESNRSTKQKNWQRHRIIKITDKHIFVDHYPFFGKSYLRQGWHAMIVFARILDRSIFERDGQYYHRPSLTTFYSEGIVKKRGWKCKVNDAEENIVIELPAGDLDWAMRQIGITEWPTTISAIKKAFAAQAMKHHPDKGGNASEFIKCKAAREFLLDMHDD